MVMTIPHVLIIFIGSLPRRYLSYAGHVAHVHHILLDGYLPSARRLSAFCCAWVLVVSTQLEKWIPSGNRGTEEVAVQAMSRVSVNGAYASTVCSYRRLLYCMTSFTRLRLCIAVSWMGLLAIVIGKQC